MKKAEQNKGFTLIEMMVYVVLVILLTATVVNLLLWTLDTGDKTEGEKKVVAAQRQAFRTLGFWIREAKDIYSPTSSSTQLSLVTTRGLPPEEDVTYVDFYKCGSRLCMKKEFADPSLVTTDAVELEKINFETIGPASHPSVRVGLRLKYKGKPGNTSDRAVSSATTTLSLREY